jgi:hypothetical protein
LSEMNVPDNISNKMFQVGSDADQSYSLRAFTSHRSRLTGSVG